MEDWAEDILVFSDNEISLAWVSYETVLFSFTMIYLPYVIRYFVNDQYLVTTYKLLL